ncbi:amino acid adenylation domain-containing protein [Brevibacillus agri]|uniref:amino acid adenylation domain-containing protein n=1 Tax=Brevibacillus agri TaxID=51101 RepID=UPI003D1C85DA
MESIERMGRHYIQILEGVVNEQNCTISEIQILTKKEREILINHLNNTEKEYSQKDIPIYRLIEEKVEEFSDQVAVVCESGQLTYCQLNTKANELAKILRSFGIGRGSIVPVIMDKSIELVISLFAIMKTGAAFCPLDINWSLERILPIVDELKSELILVNRNSPYQETFGGRAVLVEHERLTKQVCNLDEIAVEPDDPIYVIYTSGSTGRPKGVIIPHKGITNRFLWMNDFFGTETAKSVLQTTHYIYDSMVWQLFWPMINGGKTVLLASEHLLSVEYISELIYQHEVTITDFVPSVFSIIVDQLENLSNSLWNKLGSLKTIIIGGEDAIIAPIRKFKEMAPDVRLINLYGPTEASIGCVYYEITGNEEKIPIGKPISNAQIFILDSDEQLVPIGIPGEIYITGECLGIGYLNNEEKTKAAFIEHSFQNLKYKRMYKTGDIARWLPDGNIDFLGRTDYQVKINGHRIELGEIESQLRQHHQVKDAVTIAREVKGQKLICAYVVRSGKVGQEELFKYLSGKLPNFMVPSHIVFIEKIPLTSGGKINRLELPDVTENDEYLFSRDESPSNELEIELAEIWSEVLNKKHIGTKTNFFLVGGDSIKATQVISRIRKKFLINLTIHQFFQYPTIEEQIKYIVSQMRDENTQDIVRVSTDRRFQLSFAQQRLWFIEKLNPGQVSYNLPFAIRLEGPINAEILEKCINKIIERQELLRTVFRESDGVPFQVVLPSLEIPLLEVSFRSIAASELDNKMNEYLSEQSRIPFNLTSGPLIRSTLINIDDDTCVLFINMHHIISDGWSEDIFVKELFQLYESAITESIANLPNLPVQYKDFSNFQRGLHQSDVFNRHISYWKERLAGAPYILELPTDRPRPLVQTTRGSKVSEVIPRNVVESLHQLSLEEGATPYMILLTVYSVLLFRYTGKDDIIIGSPIANRNRMEIENIIGFFVNMLPIRIDLSGNPSFRQLLKRVKEVCLEAFDHQEAPFEKIVEEIKLHRDVSRNLLYQVAFTLQNTLWKTMKFAGVTASPIEIENGTSKIDIAMFVKDFGEELKVIIEYNSDLFDNESMKRLLNHYLLLLKSVLVNPEQQIELVSFISDVELRQVLVEWNQKDSKYPDDKCIHELFEEQVERTPDRVALAFEDKQLTYRELNQRANKLANYLIMKGVGPEVPVGICIDRSIDMVVGLLGILKSGGAYVPLDPRYPKDRLSFITQDTGLQLIVSNSQLAVELPKHNATIIYLDDDAKLIEAQSDENPVSKVSARNLAYIIYTSGTAGKPKGVLIEHQGLCNMSDQQIKAFGINQNDRVLQFSSMNFDGAFYQIIMALRVGAMLFLGSKEELLPGYPLVQFLKKHRISVIDVPPSALAACPDDELPFLKTIISGGEACTSDIVKRWSNNRNFYNAYGPTEATIWSTYFRCNDSTRRPPIGKPIENKVIYILDANLQPVPIGVPGEIYIGGVGLARGYLNRQDLTSEKFIRNPFSASKQDRLYKTGDLGRYLSDGNIEFLGRIDTQIKLRGFRIEQEEIEVALRESSPDVKEALVTVKDDKVRGKELVAYIVKNNSSSSDVKEIRRILKERLPEYMVPSVIVVLDSLPVTPNGKLDRKRLPDPKQEDRVKSEVEFVLPRNTTEQRIMEIWKEVLSIDQVGVHDNFFDIGGHSLLLAKVHSILTKEFFADIPMIELFRYPTIYLLAKYINEPAQQLSFAPMSKRSDDIKTTESRLKNLRHQRRGRN